ncbi:unnamed protein product [Calypogeia fissa]
MADPLEPIWRYMQEVVRNAGVSAGGPGGGRPYQNNNNEQQEELQREQEEQRPMVLVPVLTPRSSRTARPLQAGQGPRRQAR